MRYSLCEFEYGYVGKFYQVIDSNGIVSFLNLDGSTLDLNPQYGYSVIGDDVSPIFL